ncbi:MAG: hypothetical protein KatS3mg015_3028 [Fimbriimonadales bacterium]|nr:MAG: hypothetical protein KatS3mg015_3028 [Fimbriimonadales bacterium]
MIAKYVRTENGDYLLQVDSEVLFPRWGFAICDGEQSWEGGFGIAKEWTVVPEDEVPQDIRRKLELARQEFEELEAA